MKLLDGFFTSGWGFSENECTLKNKFQMINAALLLSGVAFIFGIVINTINDIPGFIPIEVFLLCMNILMFFVLRRYRESYDLISTIITVQCTYLMLLIIYTSDPASMKYMWLFTYPIILLYFQEMSKRIYWFTFMILMLLISPWQTFVETQFSMFQIIYIVMVLIVVSAITYFYQQKMKEARELIQAQQDMLFNFNKKLEKQVAEKTLELREMNETLETKVQDKIEELIRKDKILSVQSKQAVMGEMISMIAHQWRQPLSTITLQISNLQFKTLLGTKVEGKEFDETLVEISDSIMYLSQTIDDFQTYFHPAKDLEEIEINRLLKRAINFALPRVKEHGIDIVLQSSDKIYIKTYINELIQVVLNIINNAIDALNKKQGEGLAVHISVENTNGKILIHIQDNASGISEDDLPHIFEPYFSTKGKNGTGLGLYMSKMIMEKQFDGDITARNTDNGATFTIELPQQQS